MLTFVHDLKNQNPFSTYLTSRVNTKHVRPPPRLFSARALDEGHPLRRGHRQAVRVTGHAVRLRHL